MIQNMTRFFSMKARGAFSEAYSPSRNSNKNFNLLNLHNFNLTRYRNFSGNCAPLNI